MKWPKPSTSCTKCGAPGYDIDWANEKCGRMVNRKRCRGTNQSAIGDKDWAECPSCEVWDTGVLRSVASAAAPAGCSSGTGEYESSASAERLR
jgi:hypothetical protein